MTDEKWSVRRSRYLVANDRIKVREDDCVTPEGVEVSPYYVMEYPDWVHVVAADSDNRVLLVKQYRHGIGEFTLELPAGKIDADDADAVAAALRELREETGCEAKSAREIGVHFANPANQNNRIFTVLARGVRPVSAPSDDPTERIETVWVSAQEALRLARSDLSTLFQVGSLLLALRELDLD